MKRPLPCDQPVGFLIETAAGLEYHSPYPPLLVRHHTKGRPMSTESAIRILKEFHNDKIVDIEGKELKIISQKLLERLSEVG